MASGSGVSRAQRVQLQKSIDLAREICGQVFGVYVGELAQGRDSAIALHAQLPDAEDAVLIAVDPEARVTQIVTGIRVSRILDDRACELAILTLRSSLEGDDLVGGVRNAAMLLAQHARTPKTLNLDEPA